MGLRGVLLVSALINLCLLGAGMVRNHAHPDNIDSICSIAYNWKNVRTVVAILHFAALLVLFVCHRNPKYNFFLILTSICLRLSKWQTIIPC